MFEKGLRVNTKVYLDVMETVVLPWIQQVAGDRPWVWQQDSALFYVSKASMEWLKNHCYDVVTKELWAPNSPDLIQWIILSGAMLRDILTDFLIPPRPV